MQVKDAIKPDMNSSVSVKPGIASFENNTGNLANNVRPLLQYAANRIPANILSQTPVHILATV